MTPSNDLHVLIQSLDKSEKRYFKLFSSLQKGNKAYVKLFDAVERQKEYDEPAIRKKFAKEKFIRQLPSHKNHLQALIIKSLTLYHAERSPGSKLREALNAIEVLYHKGLHAHCLKRLDRIYKIAKGQDQYPYLLEILSWKRKIMRAGNYVDIPEEKLQDIFKEEKKALERAGNIIEYQDLENRISFLMNKTGKAKDEAVLRKYNAIIQNPYLKNISKAETLASKAMYHFIRGNYFFTDLNLNVSYSCYKQALSVLKNEPAGVYENTDLFIYILTYLIANTAALGKKKEHYAYLDEIRTIAEKYNVRLSSLQNMRVFSNSYINELLLHLNYPEEEVRPGALEAIEEGLIHWGRMINSRLKISFYINLSLLNFGLRNFKKSLHWISFLLNEEEENTNDEQANMARILHLAIHYELKNYDFLSYRIKNDIIYFEKRKTVFPAEIVLLKLLRALIREIDKNENYRLMKEARSEIMQILLSGKHRMIGFDYVSWLDSKIQRIPFSEAVARNQKVFRKIL